MNNVAVIARLVAAEGRRDELFDALGPMMTQVESEPGTEIYALHEDAADPDVAWLYEFYRDGEALDAHSSSGAMVELFGVFASDLLGAEPELHVLTPIAAKRPSSVA